MENCIEASTERNDIKGIVDNTFDAIHKLKELEARLHHLKYSLEMMSISHETKKEWVPLSDKAKLHFVLSSKSWTVMELIQAVEIECWEKNGG